MNARTLEYFVFIWFLIIFSLASFLRNFIWKDGITLWGDVASKTPYIGRVYNNLGSSLLNQERYEEAIEALKKAIKTDPRYVEPHLNLGISYMKTGRLDDAVPEFLETLRIIGFLKKGHMAQKIPFRQAILAHGYLANIYSLRGEFKEAIGHYKEALEDNPNETDIRFNLAVTLKMAGRFDEARREFEEILRILPEDSGARMHLRALPGQSGQNGRPPALQ